MVHMLLIQCDTESVKWTSCYKSSGQNVSWNIARDDSETYFILNEVIFNLFFNNNDTILKYLSTL